MARTRAWASTAAIKLGVSLLLIGACCSVANDNAYDQLAAQEREQIPIKDKWYKVGQSTLSVLFWDVYHAELYNGSGVFTDIAGPLRLSLNYLRDIDSEQLIDRTEEEWRKLGLWQQQNERWLQQAAEVFPDVVKHDQLTFQLNQDNSALLVVNGEVRHRFSSSLSNRDFITIWLSPRSSYPDFTQRLIGAQ